MDINGSIALVTGANRGLGRAIAQHLVERGADKVYAAARQPATIDIPGVNPLELDITDPVHVRRAAEIATDATLLVNNAGTNLWQPLVGGDIDQIRLELETHLFGTLGMTRAFAPILGRNGGGVVANVLSAMSWFAYPGDDSYHVAKAAQWALTNAIRLELAAQHTLVVGVHLGVADTDMSAAFEGDKIDPAAVARAALDGIEAGSWEVLIDDWSRSIKASLADDPRTFYAASFGVT
jgi:NAD(P)-dependent dehydrogenase (short-subunit alcohol dehydrogenase family)